MRLGRQLLGSAVSGHADVLGIAPSKLVLHAATVVVDSIELRSAAGDHCRRAFDEQFAAIDFG